ncbi:MAG: hypothetical protein V4682_00475 [Patescibacteria group bacterium]
MVAYVKEKLPFLLLCLVGIVVGLTSFPSLSKAQEAPSCRDREAMGEMVLACPDGLYQMLNLSSGRIIVKIDTGGVDPRSCSPEVSHGAIVARCGEHRYEWQRVNGLLSLRLIPEVSREEAQRLIYLDSARQRSAVYGYVPPECGVMIERNTQRCDDARWRRRNVVHCYGPYTGTPVYEAETCISWREQRRFGN